MELNIINAREYWNDLINNDHHPNINNRMSDDKMELSILC